jgi:hypothetical protein
VQTAVFSCEHRGMADADQLSVSITLSPTQVDDVIRAAANGAAPSVSALIADALNTREEGHDAGSPAAPSAKAPSLRGYVPTDAVDRRLSRSLLRGLSLLTCFGPERAERGIVELADELGMSPSTAHRYALTLVELGLLERCPQTRKYRLPGT